jgi:hypothetical protein
MPERIMNMKPKKSPEEIPQDRSNEEIKYLIIGEDGSRKTALLKIIDGLARLADTVTGIAEVPPEVREMVRVMLRELSSRIVKTFPEEFPEVRRP